VPLSETIISRIHEKGAISFHDFMEMALYYPEEGYYTSAKDKIGTKGDFYTSANLTPAFGAMVGRQLEEMWRSLGEEAFTIVEYGAGTGLLSLDILDYLRSNEKLYEALRYCIIEKSPAMRGRERKHLPEKVSWHDRIAEIGGIRGCILSNEFIDNLAVHSVVMQQGLMEVFVDYNDGYIELLQPARAELKEYLEELNVRLKEGSRTEINLEARDWLAEIAPCLVKGYVLTIDYGYSSEELYHESRRAGTLLCYNQHRTNDHPYEYIGQQDITTHVNFSALRHWGSKNGLEYVGLVNQLNFLVALGFEEYFDGNSVLSRATKTLLKHTLLINMGSRFKVLIQQKGVGSLPLRGLRFGCPGSGG
jgi:SAM-dependent MidA family methyltransferase